MQTVSRAFQVAAKVSSTPLYKLAIECGFPPETAYKIVRRIRRVNPDDKRIFLLGARLGLEPHEIFSSE